MLPLVMEEALLIFDVRDAFDEVDRAGEEEDLFACFCSMSDAVIKFQVCDGDDSILFLCLLAFYDG